ncbi:MAG: hypothetical protein RL330_345 [Actinomycetota bacterium]
MRIADLPTPAAVVDLAALQANIAAMSAELPGDRLRPHVKAHKCTSIARLQSAAGHRTFTCATVREMIGMAAAGLGDDVLLANECLDPARLASLAGLQDRAGITVAVDSTETVEAAARAGIARVLVDVNVGLPRCGCDPADAGRIADLARTRGMEVRGVMGYEGHLMMVEDRAERAAKVHAAMEVLAAAHRDTGGNIVSAGGTGTHDLFTGTAVTEVQAGSYALMDSQYARLGHPFVQALWIAGTVVSSGPKWSVADVGLKALGMDHGDPTIAGHRVWFCSDEHVTFSPESGTTRVRPGERVLVTPAHVDPTMAMHERVHIVDSGGRGIDPECEVVDTWSIDLRGW